MRCRAPGQRARDWGDWSDAAAAQHPRPCDLSCRVLTGPGCLDPLGAQTVQGRERSCLLPLLSTGQSADAEARRESCIVGFWPSVHILPPGRHVRAALLSRPCARERIMGLLFAVSSSAGLAFPWVLGKLVPCPRHGPISPFQVFGQQSLAGLRGPPLGCQNRNALGFAASSRAFSLSGLGPCFPWVSALPACNAAALDDDRWTHPPVPDMDGDERERGTSVALGCPPSPPTFQMPSDTVFAWLCGTLVPLAVEDFVVPCSLASVLPLSGPQLRAACTVASEPALRALHVP